MKKQMEQSAPNIEPRWPRERRDYERWSRRPDPAVTGGYLRDQLSALRRHATVWAGEVRPAVGWALAENAPGFDPAGYVSQLLTDAINCLGCMTADAQQAWLREVTDRQNVRARRLALGMTLRELARRTSCSATSLGQLERGERPSLKLHERVDAILAELESAATQPEGAGHHGC